MTDTTRQRNKAIALIPARGGSKGIKDKNIVPLAGKPLLGYAIEAALRSGVVGRVVVSSDSEGILAVGAALGAETLLRPSEFATDLASTDDAIAHFIAALQIAPETLIVLLQPTSPLRTAAHIADAVALWREKQPACLVSVFEPIEHPAKSFRLDQDGTLTGMFSADAPFQPRQILPKAFMPNGAIYVFSAGAFLVSGTIPRKGLLPFFMDRNSSLDIDCLEDLAVAERYLQKSSHD
jgi:CMP-N-acetylneuraminic acid synthetase